MTQREITAALQEEYLEKVRGYHDQYAKTIRKYKTESPHWPNEKVGQQPRTYTKKRNENGQYRCNGNRRS